MQLIFVLEQVLNGLLGGAYYLLIALGLSLIFALGGIVNLAHGGFYAIGAYLAVVLTSRIGFAGAFIASMLIGIVQTFAVALDYSLLDLLRALHVAVLPGSPWYEIGAIKIAQAAPLIPYLLLVVMLIVRPRGLLGTRDA